MDADPPGAAFPVMVQPAVFPVVRESEATRPELFCVIVEVAACALFMLEPVTDARISTSTTAESVTENFVELVLFIIPDSTFRTVPTFIRLASDSTRRFPS
jgi:hypothetical protein